MISPQMRSVLLEAAATRKSAGEEATRLTKFYEKLIEVSVVDMTVEDYVTHLIKREIARRESLRADKRRDRAWLHLKALVQKAVDEGYPDLTKELNEQGVNHGS
jgi:hypothetical protein